MTARDLSIGKQNLNLDHGILSHTRMLAPANFVQIGVRSDLMYARDDTSKVRLLFCTSRIRLHSTAATTNRTVYVQDARLS